MGLTAALQNRPSDLARGQVRVSLQFAAGALVATLGTIGTLAVLMGKIAHLVGNGRPTWAAAIVVSAAWFFAGGLIAGAALDQQSDRSRLGMAVTFMSAGALLTALMLGVWMGPSRTWALFEIKLIACTTIWTAAGLAGGLILRYDVVTVRRTVIGFALGGLAGGIGYGADLWLLASVVPPFVAGAILARAHV
jgi:hypothetical protein